MEDKNYGYNPDINLPPVEEAKPIDSLEDSEAFALRVVKADIETGKKANDAEKAKREEAYSLYRAMGDPDEHDDGRSRTKSSDVMDMIEWLMPSLMRAFFGSKNAISVDPIGAEDMRKADLFQKLLNWQFVEKGNGFRVGHEWMKASLIYGVSPIKVTYQDMWVRKGFAFPQLLEPQFEELKSNENVESLTAEKVNVVFQEVQPALQQNPYSLLGGMPNAINLTFQPPQIEPMRVYENVRGEERIKIYSGPVAEVIPPDEFLCDPEARDITDARFVIHRVKRTITYLRQKEKEGIYSRIDDVEAAATETNAVTDDEAEASARASASSDYRQYTSRSDIQKARQKVWVYEWWGLLDVDNTGVAEPYLVVVANDTIIRMERNPYAHGEPPFEIMRPILDVFTINGISMVDLVGEYQKVKTALMRQTLDNISFQNNQMWLVDSNAGVDTYGLAHPRPCRVIEADRIDGVRQIAPSPLEGSAFNVMEFIQTQLEQRTGITRYNQGLSADSLNKMLALDTPIPMADGSVKLNKDIVDGDMVIGSDGAPTKVLEAHPIQMPERAFRIEFENGDVIRAGAEHLWTVSVRRGREAYGKYATRTTADIFELITNGGYKAVVPRVKAVDYPERQLALDPYILGAWLGDGHSHTNRFTSADEEIVERFSAWASRFYKGRIEACKTQSSGKATTYSIVDTPFRAMLKDLRVLKDSRNKDAKDNIKHIPSEYLIASKKQRLELLRGLMDTDGCRYKYHGKLSGAAAVFCTSNEVLMKDVCKLVESLGGIAKITSIQPTCNNGRHYKKHYHISFTMEECPFYLARKAKGWDPTVCTTRNAIKSITEIEVEPMRCLSVEAEDRMYCCGEHYTVTRNTATGINAIMNASSQRIELIARVMAETGFRRLYAKMLKLDQQFIDQNIVIRVYNQPLEISPDDLAGNFDVSVDIGGATNRDQQEVQQMMSLLNYSQLLLQLGVMRPKNVYEVTKKILATWGIAEADRYISNPAETEMLRQVIQNIDQLAAGIQQGQVPPLEAIVQGVTQARNALASVAMADVSSENPQPGVSPAGEREASDGDMAAYAAGTIPGGPGGDKK